MIERGMVRLLVVSPLARRVDDRFLGVQWGSVTAASTPAEVREVFARERPRFDAVLVDLMWNTFEDEWTYDGLDVLAQMQRSARGEPAMLACQGHGFERDYLEEGRSHPIVRGMFLKGDPAPLLIDAVDTVTAGSRFTHPTLGTQLRPDRETLGYWFERNPLLARMAGAIAAGHGPAYADLARVLGVSTSTVEKSPSLFREILAPRGEVNQSGDIGQAAVFRWCGEHAHYILSWCRRHRSRHRELADLPDDVFAKLVVR